MFTPYLRPPEQQDNLLYSRSQGLPSSHPSPGETCDQHRETLPLFPLPQVAGRKENLETRAKG